MATAASSVSSDPYIVMKTSSHGLPYRPSCMAYDPVQQLLAIGSHHGVVTILGRTGLERKLEHSDCCGILQLQFGINRGLLLSLGCSKQNETAAYLWSFVDKKIVLLDKMELGREKLRTIYWPFGSDWIYLGTEGGDVRFTCIQSRGKNCTFVQSDDAIYWNNAAQLRGGRRDNPGEVLALQEHPHDPTKLLVGYSQGLCMVWNLKEKKPLLRYMRETPPFSMMLLTCASWQGNGKTIALGYSDGSVLEVEAKTGQTQLILNENVGGGIMGCMPIFGLQCFNAKDGGPWILYNGGSQLASQQNTLTVWSRNITKTLQFASSVVDFVCLPSSPLPAESQNPTALVVLTEQELKAFDVRCDMQVQTPAQIRLPYTLLLHPNPVTCLTCCGLCSSELEAQMTMIKTKLSSHQVRTSPTVSPKIWPIHGGNWDELAVGHCPRLIVTGHQDGTIKFWLSYEDIFEASFSVNTAAYFSYSASTRQTQKERGGASRLPGASRTGTAVKTSAENSGFGIEMINVSMSEQNFTVVNERGDVLVFKMSVSNRNETVNHHNIYLHAEDIGEEEDPDSMGTPISDECWKFQPVRHNERQPAVKVAQYCRCMVEKQGSMQPVRVNSVDYCSTVGMLAIGTKYGIAVVDTITNSCDHVVTNAKKLMSMADPSFSGTFKRVRMQSKQQMIARLTSKRSSALRMGAPQSAASSSCEVSVVTSAYLYLDNHSSTPTPTLTLWVGTATGQVAVFGVLEKAGSDQKRLEITSTGITSSKPGKVVNLIFLTNKLTKIEPGTEWQLSEGSPSSALNYLVLCTSEVLKTYTLPEKKCLGRFQLTEDVGEITSSSYTIVEDRALLASLLSTGQLLIHSLPELQPIADLSSLPMKGPGALNTFSLGILGRGAYKSSPTEIQEVTIYPGTVNQSKIEQYLPHLYVPKEGAYTPKSKGLVSNLLASPSVQITCNRGEFFRAVPGVGGARGGRGHARGDDATDGGGRRAQGYAASGPYSQLTEHLHERKEKLSKLADTTEHLADGASQFLAATKKLSDRQRK